MAPKKPRYGSDPMWADVEPFPQDDGGPNALSTIAYSEEYREATSYLRAVMANNEFSERVLGLTAHVIDMNPAHYTVWLYRAKALEALDSDLDAELLWLNATALKFIKNYQIWHHRQTLLSRLVRCPDGEFDFLAEMLDKDAKNYHVWSYRQWLVRRFGLWDGIRIGEGKTVSELDECERFIRKDVRNNSAWNHRWFVAFGREKDGLEVGEDIWDREVEFAKDAIRLAPQNESPWNYLRGLLRKANKPWSSIEDFTNEFVDLKNPDNVRSSHALDLVAEVYGEKKDKKEEARIALDLLAKKYDPIRANYWNYRKSLLEGPGAVA